MASSSQRRIEFVPEEPGPMLLLIILAVFLLFSPGGACSAGDYADNGGATTAGHDHDHGHGEH